MTVIDSIPDLIHALGGATRVARWAGYEDCRGVMNWVPRGIPPSYHLRLVFEAMRRGMVISPEVFGLTGDDADELLDVFRRARPRAPRRPNSVARHASR